MKYYTQYRGIFYKFIPIEYFTNKSGQTEGFWQLSDRQDNKGLVMSFNSKTYQIQDLFEKFAESWAHQWLYEKSEGKTWLDTLDQFFKEDLVWSDRVNEFFKQKNQEQLEKLIALPTSYLSELGGLHIKDQNQKFWQQGPDFIKAVIPNQHTESTLRTENPIRPANWPSLHAITLEQTGLPRYIAGVDPYNGENSVVSILDEFGQGSGTDYRKKHNNHQNFLYNK